MRTTRLLAITFVLGAVATANAAQQTYSFSGIISGSLGGTSFSSKQFSIVGIGDSSTILPAGFGWTNTLSSNTLTISGFGPVSITGLGVFMNNSTDIVGAWIPSVQDIYDVSLGEDHNLTGPYGPKTGATLGNLGASFATSGGAFVINSFDSLGTYSVGAVPEPATFAALGLGALMLRRRKRA